MIASTRITIFALIAVLVFKLSGTENTIETVKNLGYFKRK